MTSVFLTHRFLAGKQGFAIEEIPTGILMLLGLIFSMLLVDFISGKNDLTQNNTFRIFLFAIFTALFPQIFSDTDVLTANLFVLLAVRRIISMQSKKELSKKIIDASLWITIAVCFSFWAVWFFALLFAAIILYRENMKQFFIPFAGIAAVILPLNAYTIITKDAYFIPSELFRQPDFDFSPYYHLQLWIPALLVVFVFLWALVQLLIFTRKRRKQKAAILLYTYTAACFLIVLLFPYKSGSETLFFAMPFSVVVSNYLERPKHKYFKEIALWLLLILSIAVIYMNSTESLVY